jgi:2-polyprenyl-3-methyl-5-hydroxy-6-metoxy-1,4-benzoquinol methylase
MPLLSNYARKRKIRYFIDPLPKSAKILEVGCAGGWLGRHLRTHGWNNYLGLDLVPPADFVGDIRNWKRLGLSEASFDAIVAFEVVEHVDCFEECYKLARPGGLLLLTTPVPCMDWFLWCLERLGLNQRRTSPHSNLCSLKKVRGFEPVSIQIVAGLSQWAVFRRPG